MAGVYKPRGAKKFPTCAQKRLPKARVTKAAAANNNAGRRRS
ncbi:hypothetical protein HMPREF1978_00638 [Actinomyces graevenitzii F0530]|uniref:Uncharacterized protein n=1 Tax=Actinomyces graevenitzii F0530 TaxID=1321817 RepID=U1RCF6_9ACTO|nr:hypothetical protein HMPREF1978_00638 [Actinomyces graevenitzii F0530]